jgi:hypothetical protein
VTIFYCLIWDSPNLEVWGSRIYIRQEQAGPVITPGHWVPFTSSLTSCRATVEVEVTLWLTISQSMSWYRVPLWDLRPDIISCRNVAVWNLRSCIYWAPSLTRGWVCNLQCNHSIVRVTQNQKPYFTVSSETPPIWRARFPYLYNIYICIPQEQGCPVIPPGTGFPLRRLLRLAGLRWRYSNPPSSFRDRSPYI